MQLAGYDIGVCSWSLTRDERELPRLCRDLGLSHVQLALGPLLGRPTPRQAIDELRQAGLTITAGMMGFVGEDYSSIARIRLTGGFVPGDTWEARRAAMLAAAQLAADTGIAAVSTHVGFLPSSSQETYTPMLGRLRGLATEMAALGVELLLETGQEAASALLQFLNDLNCRNVHVNFDPANMLLYGVGDPIEAIPVLGRHIRHVHLKDAIMSEQPGIHWGREMPVGQGHVRWPQFVAALRAAGYAGPLVVECEAGADRLSAVRSALVTIGQVG